MRDLLLDDDFELIGAGELRLATPVESVAQEIGRLAEEAGWLAGSMTPGLAVEIQGKVLALLREHPDVATPGAVSVIAEANQTYIKAEFDGQSAEVGL